MDEVQLIEVNLEHKAKTLQHALLAMCHPTAVEAYQQSGWEQDLVMAKVVGFCTVDQVLTDALAGLICVLST
jgi:hypothetical protein